MAQGYPILGESLELYQAAENCAKKKQKTIEKNENAKKQVIKVVKPMIEKMKKQ